jgi:hypothetical protein
MYVLHSILVHAIIATPGRILDLLNKNLVKIGKCGIMVLDEVNFKSTDAQKVHCNKNLPHYFLNGNKDNASIIPGTKMSDIFYNSNIRLIYRGFNKILTSMTRKYGLNVSTTFCNIFTLQKIQKADQAQNS